MPKVYDFRRGQSALLVSIPHSGMYLPEDIESQMTGSGRRLKDADWYVDRLYNFLGDSEVSVLKANYSRYVIDLNRPADGTMLYPGKSETELCPTTTFSNEKLYKDGTEPTAENVRWRTEQYWQPYHARLRDELNRIRTKFGYAILWDAHSIRSEVPRFFEGHLPELNLGTADGSSCDNSMDKTPPLVDR